MRFVDIEFFQDNKRLLIEGKKTSTLRSVGQAIKIGMHDGETALCEILGVVFLVTCQGQKTVSDLGGKEAVWKTEGFDFTGGPKLQQTLEFLEGKITLYYYTLRPAKDPEVLKVNPDRDGIDHINVYSRGKTELGRFLTNFTKASINSPEHGRFASVEGYWYWLGCNHPDKDRLRSLWGYEANKVGRELNALDWQETPDFKRYIKRAIFAKIFNNPKMALELKKSSLPLRHYYDYKGRVIEPEDGKWVIDFLENLRRRMNNCSNLAYRDGDLFEAPAGICLAQSCNTLGAWGAGIAVEFKNRFPKTYLQQQSLCNEHLGSNYLLGQAHLNQENGYTIASLFTSRGFGKNTDPAESILSKTALAIQQLISCPIIKEVWMPRINSGLFRVPWELTEVVLIGVLLRRPDVRITVSQIQ